MNRMAAVFQGDGWKVVSFAEVKRGDKVVMLDDDEAKVAVKDAYQKPIGQPYEGAWTLALSVNDKEFHA